MYDNYLIYFSMTAIKYTKVIYRVKRSDKVELFKKCTNIVCSCLIMCLNKYKKIYFRGTFINKRNLVALNASYIVIN